MGDHGERETEVLPHDVTLREADAVEAPPETDSGAGERVAIDPAPRVVPAFDGFRGIAALMIVAYHCWLLSRRPGFGFGPVQALLSGANLGVDMFFVISGFVLFLPTARTGSFGSGAAYAVRRVARIVPAYFVYVAVVLLLWDEITLPIPAHTFPLDSTDGIVSLLSHLSFSQGVVLGPLARVVGYDTPFSIGPIAQTWSLSVEASFYLVLPFVARAFLRRPLVGLVTGIAIAIGWRVLMTDPISLVQGVGFDPDPLLGAGLRHQLFFLLPGFAGHFAIGMALAWFVVKASREPRLVSWLHRRGGGLVAYCAASTAVAVTWWLWGHEILEGTLAGSPAAAEAEVYVGVFGALLFAAAFGLFALVAVLGPRWARWPWDTFPLRFLGDISYGVFLWHYAVLWFVIFNLRITVDGDAERFLVFLGVTLAITLPLAWISRRVVEQPAIKVGRKISGRLEARRRVRFEASEERLVEARQW
jgi:peptidoglycan/LPS O-acetylase OafA/YrhL